MPRPSVSLSLRLFLTWAGCAAPPRVSSTVPKLSPEDSALSQMSHRARNREARAVARRNPFS